MKLRAVFTKIGIIKFISHLDLVRLFQRAFNRAEVPLLYTEGFSPHPKFSIGKPLSLGVESEREYLDLEVEEEYNWNDFTNDMNKVLPEGIKILEVSNEFVDIPLANIIEYSQYEMLFEDLSQVSKEELDLEINKLLAIDEILMSRKRKKGRRKIVVDENIRGKIVSLKCEKDGQIVKIKGVFTAGELNNLRPDIFLEALLKYGNLHFEKDMVHIKRLDNFNSEMKNIR